MIRNSFVVAGLSEGATPQQVAVRLRLIEPETRSAISVPQLGNEGTALPISSIVTQEMNRDAPTIGAKYDLTLERTDLPRQAAQVPEVSEATPEQIGAVNAEFKLAEKGDSEERRALVVVVVQQRKQIEVLLRRLS